MAESPSIEVPHADLTEIRKHVSGLNPVHAYPVIINFEDASLIATL